MRRIAARYSARSAWQRVARTAGPLRGIERAPLDAGGIGGARHDAAERVDFLDQVALADAADRRVAAHRADGLDVVREQQRARTGARGRERGFGAGVAAADHDDVVAIEGLGHGVNSGGAASRRAHFTCASFGA